MALTKITANIIEDGAISTASLANTSITADKLAATLDLTGKTITVATATAGDNDTTVASTAFVSTAIANLADSAPETLNTLNELAAALGDDANFSTTVTNSIALKAPLASPTFTGTLTASGLVYPTSDGTNGQVLTTDGAGNLSFADSAGGVDGIVSSADATAITIDSSENVTFTGSGSFGSNVTALTSFNSTTGNDLRLNAGSVNRDIFLQVNGSTLMTIQGSTGNVGIGAAPQSAPYYNNDNPALTVQKASGNAILPIVAAANTSSAILHLNQSANRYWRLSALYGGALTFGGKQPGSGAGESEAMRIESAGYVGMGISNPSAYSSRLVLNSLGTYTLWQTSTGVTRGVFGSSESGGQNWTYSTAGTGNYGSANGDLYWQNGSNTTFMYFDQSATTVVGDFVDTSDVGLKENIVDTTDGLSKLLQLQPRKFDWKEENKANQVNGFIAQEVETVLPNEVSGEDYDETSETGASKAINTSGILAVAVKAIQEQQTIIDDLKSRIEALEE